MAAGFAFLHALYREVLYQRIREVRGMNYGDYAYPEHFEQDGWGTFPLANVARRDQYFSIWLRPLRPEQAHFAIRLAIHELRAMARLDLVGARYGPNLPELRRLLSEGSFEVSNGTLRAGGFVLGKGEFTLDYSAREGWAVEHGDDYVVGVDTRLDDELRLEGRVYDLIHAVQGLRRDAGLEISDRIVLTLPDEHRDLLEHEDWIKGETLATHVEMGGELAVRKDE